MVVGASGLQSGVGPRALTFVKSMPSFAHIGAQASKTSGKTKDARVTKVSYSPSYTTKYLFGSQKGK